MMRPTLHEYNLKKLSDLDCTAISDVLNFTKITNRAPELGDFVPCDENGNVLEEPKNYDKWLSEDYYTEVETTWIRNCSRYQAAQSRTIFKGEWDATHEQYYTFVIDRSLRIRITFCDDQCDVSTWDIDGDFFEDLEIHRIEDLPREIEFKEGVI